MGAIGPLEGSRVARKSCMCGFCHYLCRAVPENVPNRQQMIAAMTRIRTTHALYGDSTSAEPTKCCSGTVPGSERSLQCTARRKSSTLHLCSSVVGTQAPCRQKEVHTCHDRGHQILVFSEASLLVSTVLVRFPNVSDDAATRSSRAHGSSPCSQNKVCGCTVVTRERNLSPSGNPLQKGLRRFNMDVLELRYARRLAGVW